MKALYPEWTPPADLRGAAPVATTDPELERLWTLFGEGNLSEVRSAIAARTAADGSWQPPQDLLDKLGAAEAARRLVNASNAGQWTTVLDVATQAPGLLTCGTRTRCGAWPRPSRRPPRRIARATPIATF